MSQETRTRIDVSQAVRSAFDFVQSVIGAQEPVIEMRLEEVDFADDHDAWLITISFLREMREDTVELPTVSVLRGALSSSKKYRRELKTVEVDAASGAARRLKVWTPD